MRTNQRIITIFESPITGLNIDDNTINDRRGYFKNADKKLLAQYKKSSVKVLKAFDKTPYKFRMFIADVRKIVGVGKREYNRHINNIAKYYALNNSSYIPQKLGIYPKEGEITVIYMSNLGAEWYPMTPWILAHRLGHAIADDEIIIKSESFNDLMGLIYDMTNWYTGNDNESNNRIKTYNDLFNTKTARTEKITNPSEIPMEIIAEYIIKGKIELKQPKHLYSFDIETLTGIETKFNQFIDEILKNCVGEILVSV